MPSTVWVRASDDVGSWWRSFFLPNRMTAAAKKRGKVASIINLQLFRWKCEVNVSSSWRLGNWSLCQEGKKIWKWRDCPLAALERHTAKSDSFTAYFWASSLWANTAWWTCCALDPARGQTLGLHLTQETSGWAYICNSVLQSESRMGIIFCVPKVIQKHDQSYTRHPKMFRLYRRK